MKNLDYILRPKSIAVIGASRRENSIGWHIVDNLLANRFAGPVYPINPSAASIHSIKAYPAIGDVPGTVELAIIVVPGEFARRKLVAAGLPADRVVVKPNPVLDPGGRALSGGGLIKRFASSCARNVIPRSCARCTDPR